jgi:hypothetical protein
MHKIEHRILQKFLKDKEIEYFKNLYINDLRFDIYLPKYNVGILYDLVEPKHYDKIYDKKSNLCGNLKIIYHYMNINDIINKIKEYVNNYELMKLK